MGGDIFTQLTEYGGLFVQFLKDLIIQVMTIFYTTPTTVEGVTTGGLTDFGKLTLIGVAIGFVYFILNWARRLIKLRG